MKMAWLWMVGIVVLSSLATRAASASNADGACTVQEVNFEDDSGGRVLIVGCASGNSYRAFLNAQSTGCALASGTSTNNSAAVDNVKTWQAIATAAYLSGRTAQITWKQGSTTCGQKLILGVELLH